MKIVCEACQAKYSIADEKVRGKVFKIRCKKCSHVIVVKGSEEASAAGEFSAAPVSSSQLAAVGGEAVWHIVVEGEQVGPLSEADVRTRLTRGEVSGESFIWREGFSDWVKISSLAEFSDLDGAPNLGYAAAATPGSVDPFAGLSADPADPYSAATAIVPTPMAELFAAPAAPAANPFGGFDAGVSASGAGSAAAAGGAMTGQRHENSVLFSLSNLESLAKPGVPAAASAPNGSGAARPGAGTGPTDGSGLIDIRSMAAMVTNGSSPAGGGLGAFSSPMGGMGGSNDLPTFAPTSFAPIAPVMLPMGQSSGTPKWVFGLLAVMGVVVVGATVVIVKVMTAPKPAPAVSEAALPTAVDPALAVAAVPAVPAVPTTPPPSVAPPADEKLPPREDTKPATADSAGTSKEKGAKPAKGGGSSKKPEKAAKTPDPEPAKAAVAAAPVEKPSTKAEPDKKKNDSIDDLLAAATGSKKAAPKRDDDDAPAKKEAPAAPGSDRQLASGDIVRAMTPVVSKVRDCYNQFKVPGMVELKLVVAPSGKVSPTVAGKFAGTPSGDCVESAAKGAKFPPSAGGTFTYPVPLR